MQAGSLRSTLHALPELDGTLRSELEGHGMVFNDVTSADFQQKLKDAGFYSEWKGKFGDEAWGTLEAAIGHPLQ